MKNNFRLKCCVFINFLLFIFIVITVSQIDIAILRILYSEITTIFTIRLLLNDKTFIVENDETFIVDSFISEL